MDLLAFNTIDLPTLWVLISIRTRASMLVVNLQHIIVSFSLANFLHTVSLIYGETTVFARMDLWDDLRQVASLV